MGNSILCDVARDIDQYIRPEYECGRCGEVHEDYDEAKECCAPEVKEVYRCRVCSDLHDNEQDAIDCCAEDPDAKPYVSKAELEAAGQMRLLP